ncbi:MAG: shikimate kinase [Verrucomicrobiae bacterium]|nr:shikimate kinase [Verrucomicrobiae bacterium]
MNIVLIGLKSCGKTSVGRALAAKLGIFFVDTDELIMERHGNPHQSIREICLQHGENYFRNLETEVIATLAALDDAVVATGGGAVLEEENIKNLKKRGRLIYLDLSFEVWKSRIQQHPLPTFIRNENFADHYDMRNSIYHKIADLTIPVDQYSIGEIVDIVIKKAFSLQPSASSLSYVQ